MFHKRPNLDRDLDIFGQYLGGVKVEDIAQEFGLKVFTTRASISRAATDVLSYHNAKHGTRVALIKAPTTHILALKERWMGMLEEMKRSLNNKVTIENSIIELGLPTSIRRGMQCENIYTIKALVDAINEKGIGFRLIGVGVVGWSVITEALDKYDIPYRRSFEHRFYLLAEFIYHNVRVRLEASGDKAVYKVSYCTRNEHRNNEWNAPLDVVQRDNLTEAKMVFADSVENVIKRTSVDDLFTYMHHRAEPTKEERKK